MSKDSTVQKKMRKNSKETSKEARRRMKKAIRRMKKKSIVFEYQMKSCMTWEYATDFRDVENWHESLRADCSDTNIIKIENFKNEGESKEDILNGDDIALGSNQSCLKQSGLDDSSLKNPSPTAWGSFVEETPIPPVEASADIVHLAPSEYPFHATASYLAGTSDNFIAETSSADGPPNLAMASAEVPTFSDTNSSNENVQISSHQLKCRNIKTKEKLTAKRQRDRRAFRCTICPKTFKTKAHMKCHEFIHSGERPFECKQCSKAFVRFQHLESHQRTHTNEKPFKCTQCPREFAQQQNLNVHVRIHSGSKPYKCSDCPKEFSDPSALKRHTITHSDKRPYQCTECLKTFKQSHCLTVHQRTHSGPFEKPFECTFCPKKFSDRRQLKIHQRTHTGERPYKCTQCPKRFTQNAHLRTHQLIHSGVKAYKCQQCSKAFSRQHHLTTHLRTHSGIKPFQCAYCEKRYAQSGDRKRHVLKFHSDKDGSI